MKHWFRKWIPALEKLKRDKSTRWLTIYLHRYPYLLKVNRKTVSRGVAAGLLVAFIPLPLQIFLSALLAFLFRANLPIAIVSTLVSNPFTFIPLTYVIYKLGVLITHSNGMNGMPPVSEFHFHWGSFSKLFPEFLTWFSLLGKTYLVGLVVFSVSAAILGYSLVNIIWRIHILMQLRKRKMKHKLKK